MSKHLNRIMLLRNMSIVQKPFANLNKKGFSMLLLAQNKCLNDGLGSNKLIKTVVRFQSNEQTTNTTETTNEEIKKEVPKSTSLPSSVFRCSVHDPVSS